MIPVLSHSTWSTLMALLGSLAHRQSGFSSACKENSCGNSLVVPLSLCPASSPVLWGLPSHRRSPRQSMEWGRRSQESGGNLLGRKEPKHALQQHCSSLWDQLGNSLKFRKISFSVRRKRPLSPISDLTQGAPRSKKATVVSTQGQWATPQVLFPSSPSSQTGHEVYWCPKVV